MLGLDRKQMEAERLARLAKKRGPSDEPPSGLEPPQKVQRKSRIPSNAAERPISPPPLARTAAAKSKQAARRSASPPAQPHSEGLTSSSAQPSTLHPSLTYPNGIIKRTWCFGHPRDGTDIKFEEVLEKSTLKIAVLSSWQLDFDWLTTKIHPVQSKLYLIMQQRDPTARETWAADAAKLGIRTCFPKMSAGPGVMHSKLMLLFHKEKLRIVIPSANLVNYDWGETGVMENVVFLIDLPRLPGDRQGNHNDTLTPFGKSLVRYLEAQAVEDDVRMGVLKFDFSRMGHLAFVQTMPDGHAIFERTGFPALADAVKALGLASEHGEELQVDFHASSIGSLNSSIASDLYGAFRGEGSSSAATPHSLDNFRIHFPSLDTVKAATGGTNSAGTLFFAPQPLNPDKLTLMRDAQSTRPGLLSHAKYAIARSATQAFVYVGSANLSQAAWGKMTRPRKKGAEAKLTAKNWECGVLMRVDVEGGDADGDGGGVIPMERIKGKVPLMFEIPGRPYVDEKGDVKKPWMVKGGR